MTKGILLIAMLARLGLCEIEVIPITGELSDRTLDILWPVYANGGIVVQQKELFMADGDNLYIQSRQAPADNTHESLKRHKDDALAVYDICVDAKNIYYLAVNKREGLCYLYKKNRRTGEVSQPVSKHWHMDRMLKLPKSNILASGIYRPGSVKFMAKHYDFTLPDRDQPLKDKIDTFFLEVKAFTLAIYNEDLVLVDSANTIDRVGENVRAFERLYIIHPVDVTSTGEILLIDNSDGYVVEKYVPPYRTNTSFQVMNGHFINAPEEMSMEKLHSIRKQNAAYSVPYALYIKDSRIITGFFQAPVRGEDVEPPYYYDISTFEGELIASGQTYYPILCEDEGDKVFFLVEKDGGWLEEDQIYLVGLTIEDFLQGKAKKEVIDKLISEYEEK